MPGPNFSLMPGDWPYLERIINDLSNRIIDQEISVGSDPVFGTPTMDSIQFTGSPETFAADITSGAENDVFQLNSAGKWENRSDLKLSDGANIGIASDTDLLTLTSNNLTVAGSVDATSFTDGIATLTGGNLSGVDVDISAGTGDYISTGDITLSGLDSIIDLSGITVTNAFQNIFKFNNRCIDTAFAASICSGFIASSSTDDNWIALVGKLTTSNILRVGVDNDVNSRFTILASGQMRWGGGAGTGDTILFRAGANHLKTDDAFTALGAITGASVTVDGHTWNNGIIDSNSDDFTIQGEGDISLISEASDVVLSAIVDQFIQLQGTVVVPKTTGIGIKVDTTTPTFGFADLLGDQFSKNTGATKPTLAAYNGVINAWQFSNGDEANMSFHIPHDYVAGTDVHLHIHWSQNAAGATGGTIDFRYTAIYAKGHNQVSGSTFTSTPKTALFSSININDGGSGLNQYQQHLTEVTISAATVTAALFDRDDFEPDGVIELTLEMDADNLTGTPSSPFIHFVDIHYQTTGIIGTKSRTPDFYV